MSDDDNDDRSQSGSSSDESEDINVTGLVATRTRRDNAGNLYEGLRAHLDDEDLQQELLAEDEAEDAEDYEGSEVDGDDDNDALDSSSDDEDAGPGKEGEAEDLAGEIELMKAERAETNKKRKAQAAKLTVPAWHKNVKKVKLAEDVTADDGSSSSMGPPRKKKKKSERSDWRPVGEDLPKRQSIRASAVANREVIQANLEESAQRATKQRATLQETIKRERTNVRAQLTLEQRYDKCKRIERETAKELGRFEREEAERVRLREDALFAKRRRHLDGPVIKTVTTSGYYEDGRLKIKRLLHGSQSVDEIMDVQKTTEAAQSIDGHRSGREESGRQIQRDPTAQLGLVEVEQGDNSAEGADTVSNDGGLIMQLKVGEREHDSVQGPAQAPGLDAASMLAQQEVNKTGPEALDQGSGVHSSDNIIKDNSRTQDNSSAPLTASDTALALPSDSKTSTSASTSAAPQTSAPVLREQAQRTLVILESFDSLDGVRRSKAASALEPTPIAQILLPDSYPSFNDEQAVYLKKARKLKQELLVKARCALTTWPGKYRDPKTGVVYADVAAYKMLQRMIAGGCTWNSMLECWTGPAYGKMGRPARGVPEGFDSPSVSAEPGS